MKRMTLWMMLTLFGAAAPFAAGQGWDYSDTNYIVLGMILERLTGRTLYEEIQRRLLGQCREDRLGLGGEHQFAGLRYVKEQGFDPDAIPDQQGQAPPLVP